MNREDPKRVHVLSAQQREMLVEFVWNCESSLDGAIGAYNLNADLDQELFEQTTDVNPQGYGNAQGDDEELVVEVDQTEGNRQDEQARPAVRLSGKLLPTPLHAPLSPTETSKGGAKLSSDVYVIEGHLESGVAIPLDGEFNPKPKRGVPMMLFTPGIRDDNNYGSMTSKAGMMLFTPSKSNRTSSFNSLTAKTSSVGKPKHGADNGNESLSSTQNQHDGSLRDPRGALWSLEQPNASFRVGIDLFGVAHSLRESFASLGHGARCFHAEFPPTEPLGAGAPPHSASTSLGLAHGQFDDAFRWAYHVSLPVGVRQLIAPLSRDDQKLGKIKKHFLETLREKRLRSRMHVAVDDTGVIRLLPLECLLPQECSSNQDGLKVDEQVPDTDSPDKEAREPMIPHGTNRFLFTPVKRSSATSSTDGNQNKQELGVCADKKKLPETTKHVQLAVGKYDLEQLALAATLLQTVDERAGPKARLKMAQKKRNARRKKHDCMVEELMSPLLDDRAVFFYEAGNDVVEDGDSLNFEEVKNPKKNPAHRGSVPSGTRTSSGAKNSGTPKSGRAAAPYGSASFSASPAPASRNRKGMNTQTNSKQPKNPFVFKESEHIYDRSKIDSPSSSPAEKIAATFYLPLKQQRDGAKKKAPRGVGFPPYEDYSTNYPQRSASSNVEMKGNSNSSTSMTNGAAAIDISTSLLYDLPGPPPVLSADGRVDVFPSLRNRPGPVLDVPINYQVIRSDDDKVKVEDAQHTTRTAPCSPTREENYALRRRRAACKQEWRAAYHTGPQWSASPVGGVQPLADRLISTAVLALDSDGVLHDRNTNASRKAQFRSFLRKLRNNRLEKGQQVLDVKKTKKELDGEGCPSNNRMQQTGARASATAPSKVDRIDIAAQDEEQTVTEKVVVQAPNKGSTLQDSSGMICIADTNGSVHLSLDARCKSPRAARRKKEFRASRRINVSAIPLGDRPRPLHSSKSSSGTSGSFVLVSDDDLSESEGELAAFAS